MGGTHQVILQIVDFKQTLSSITLKISSFLDLEKFQYVLQLARPLD